MKRYLIAELKTNYIPETIGQLKKLDIVILVVNPYPDQVH